jgi:hypothetical protein
MRIKPQQSIIGNEAAAALFGRYAREMAAKKNGQLNPRVMVLFYRDVIAPYVREGKTRALHKGPIE